MLSQTLNFARSSVTVPRSDTKGGAQRSCTVMLPCPKSFTGNCPYKERIWSCEKCKSYLKYDFEDHFYCKCGEASINSFTFKCDRKDHGDKFEALPDDDIEQFVRRMKAVNDINILVLGETGVGKSTWINAIANYMTFTTFEEAEVNIPTCLIPSIHETTNRNGRKCRILIGKESDRELIAAQESNRGQSVTQFPASYVFKYGDLAIRLIDTPGIGDTRGLEADKANLQNILDHISNFDELHGICILLPANLPRLTVQFKFCIKGLLSQLHCDACKNIMFCFTHSRSTDYTPGDTVTVLNEMLKESVLLKENNVFSSTELTPKTLYCMDNEAISYLFAIKQGIQFDSTSIRETRMTSWNTSVAETGRLLGNIVKLKPHKVKYTVSLNETRRVILGLCKGPLVEISCIIQTTVCKLLTDQKELQKVEIKREELDNKRLVPKVEHRPLRRPQVICTSEDSPECTASTKTMIGLLDDYEHIEYGKVCCKSCRAPHLRMCNCFRLTATCSSCGCNIQHHFQKTYDVFWRTVRVADPEEDKKFQALKTQAEQKAVIVKQISEELAEYQREQMSILEAAAQLMRFIETNSVINERDVFLDVLNHQIMVERKLAAQRRTDGKPLILDELQKLLSSYTQFRSSMQAMPTQENNTVDDITMLVEKLYAQKMCGKMLKSAVKGVEIATVELIKSADVVLSPELHKIVPGRQNPVQQVLTRINH